MCEYTGVTTVWLKNSGDIVASHTTLLTLRSDGTYTKQFAAAVGGPLASLSRGFGGIHDGTWTREGDLIYLSGDGNWPPYTEDLKLFRQIS
jgi:hypothetical protein